MRAVSTTLGVVLLSLVTVCAAATVGVVGVGTLDTAAPNRPVAVDVTAASNGRVTLVHRAGPPLDVRRIRLAVAVDGAPLSRQPPVPFFAAPGFRGGPTGPFNAASDPTWTTGERAGFRVAGTNAPALTPGATLVVTVYRDGTRLSRARTTVTGSDGPSSRTR